MKAVALSVPRYVCLIVVVCFVVALPNQANSDRTSAHCVVWLHAAMRGKIVKNTDS